MSTKIAKKNSRAFTLVELLVVITIIGILMGLLLPTLSAVRETARRTQCMNNLNGIGKGILLLETKYGHFPSGGRGYQHIGDPDEGFGLKQGGGFLYAILPFIDLLALHDLPNNGGNKRQLTNEMCQTPVQLYTCPTRRPCQNFSGGWPDSNYVNADMSVLNASCFHACYAINGGTSTQNWGGEAYDWATDGICTAGRLISLTEVMDGLGNTLLAAEKYLDPNCYTNGSDGGDDQAAFSGDSLDQVRWGENQPSQEIAGLNDSSRFGGPHTGSFNAVFCDISVKKIRFSITKSVYYRLLNKADGQPVNLADFAD